ncbi:MAG: adenylate/guanylate cyclase domain-containing protein, partial [Desulfovibrio sp.]|nr:adenylate/guanylate cyclase domain-containing protein [Desulfovibrio sp.]
CGEDFAYVEMDSVRVKGKSEPITIYTAMTHEARAAREEDFLRYEKGLALYKAMHFAEAAGIFARLQSKSFEEVLCGMYEERCQHLMDEPPGGSWDGVYTHKEK